MRLLTPGKFAYVYDFDRSEPDLPPTFNWRNRVQFSEAGRPITEHRMILDEVLLVGGGRWVHEPGRVVFSTTDNSDPRTNGRIYALVWPLFYGRGYGRIAALALLLSGLGLYGLNRRGSGLAPASSPRETGRPSSRHWHWHLTGAAGLFLIGLYCNTGTLTPYAITTWPYLVKATGYLYNPDHVHFQVLYAFVNHGPRVTWDHALFLRRILFPVLGWPLMRLLGFEIGGTATSLLLNTAAVVGFVLWLRHRVGQRGAIFAGWLLALSPGATYFGGLPYPYALIFPGSLLLMAALFELGEAANWRRVIPLSLGMGLLYLGYDFTAFFLPASIVLLAAKRRFGVLALTVPLQLAPVLGWLLMLKCEFHQSLANSNTGIYTAIFSSYFAAGAWIHWRSVLGVAFDTGCYAFFGANFIFLPGLFLVVTLLNAVTSRIRFLAAELALFLAVGAIFLLNNLAPAYGGWDMHGTWISRIYQPVFAAFLLFAARWWQDLPKISRLRRAVIASIFLLTMAGNALIVFGPITFNPLGISEFAYYRFYNHNDVHWAYEYNLRQFGRRPLGFPKPQP
jgi:hypothetical protein